MKAVYIYFLSLFFSCFVISCKKSGIGENLSAPKVSISVYPENPKIGDTVTVTLSTDGEYLSVFTGDSTHDFEKSRIKSIIENNWSSFYDTVYRVSYAKNGEATVWNRYLKDYNTLDEVKKDFQFFGSISDISLGVYNNFPEALMNTTYPTMNQLKFTITDRRIPSGIIIKPNIYLLGGKDNNPAFSIFETRFVADTTDKAIRKIANNANIPAIFDVSTHASDTNKDTTLRGSQWYYRAFQTDDPLSARPSEGFYNFSEFYNGNPYLQSYLNNAPDKLAMTQLKMYMNGRATEFTGSYSYDLDNDGTPESYEVELNPATGLPVNESDYTKYAGFQGDVYVSYINLGTDEYEPWNTGVSLGSIYTPIGIQTEYKYVYKSAGQFTITALATNVGRKDYSGDGYQSNRDYSLNDYPAKRSTAIATIGVKN